MTEFVLDLLAALPRFEGTALCHDPQATAAERRELAELFFPIAEDSEVEVERVAAAKALCGRCPVRAGCLQFALRTGEEGVWGGTTTAERRQVRLLGCEAPDDDGAGEVAA